jgi:quercetin dioxygenase-like cupin family protein
MRLRALDTGSHDGNRRSNMLTRRDLVGCALCALAGFAATDAGAQGTQTGGLKRTILTRIDGPTPGYETIEAKVEIDAGAIIAKHTHFGVETTFVVDGSLYFEAAGQEPKTYSKGEAIQVAPGVVHGGKAGDAPVLLSAVYVVDKGKPLATPA